MSSPGETDDLLVRARSALLDALDALGAHRDSVVVIGAQAIYLRTAGAPVAVAEATKDSDIAIDPRCLGDEPLIEAAMGGRSSTRTRTSPARCLGEPAGIPVDLMVPEELAGGGGKSACGAHGSLRTTSMRRRRLPVAWRRRSLTTNWMIVAAIDEVDDRRFEVRVRGTGCTRGGEGSTRSVSEPKGRPSASSTRTPTTSTEFWFFHTPTQSLAVVLPSAALG